MTRQRYLQGERLAAQPLLPAAGRYDIRDPLEPERQGWTFRFTPSRRGAPLGQAVWSLFDSAGVLRYVDTQQPSEPGETQDDSDAEHWAEVAVLSAMIVPWQLGSLFGVGDAEWQELGARSGMLMASQDAGDVQRGEPMLTIDMDELERVVCIRAGDANGPVLAAWTPLEDG